MTFEVLLKNPFEGSPSSLKLKMGFSSDSICGDGICKQIIERLKKDYPEKKLNHQAQVLNYGDIVDALLGLD